MGQTLTHGIYLPDEGERNCYDGLASNWQLLDGAVGTVAEHTSQIAGKAPLVHTHTKSDITDFPVYGTTAGTICEGNDSRLSDARTPVAHTHLTADVTDLLNSSHTWSGDNTYSKTVAIERSTDTGNFLALKNTVAELGSTPASATPVTIAFRDKDNDSLGYMGVYYDTDGSNHFRLYVRNKYTSGAPSTTGSYDYAFFGLRLNADKSKEGIIKASFRPYDNNTHDLGSSSYQWKSVYAQSYYYNGVAWGLDKANEWSNEQIFSRGMCLSGDRNAYIYPMWAGAVSGIAFLTMDASKQFVFGQRTTDANNRYVYDTTKGFLIIRAGETGGYTTVSVIPFGTDTKLGDSTNKFKTLNGVNPGALSLPNIEAATNLAGDITDFTGATQLSLNSGFIGWVYIQIPNVQGDYIEVQVGNSASIRYFVSAGYSDSLDSIEVLVPKPPVVTKVRVKATGGAVSKALFYPCLGNV